MVQIKSCMAYLIPVYDHTPFHIIYSFLCDSIPVVYTKLYNVRTVFQSIAIIALV